MTKVGLEIFCQDNASTALSNFEKSLRNINSTFSIFRLGATIYVANSLINMTTEMHKASRAGDSVFLAFASHLPVINRLSDSIKNLTSEFSGLNEAQEKLKTSKALADIANNTIKQIEVMKAGLPGLVQFGYTIQEITNALEAAYKADQKTDLAKINKQIRELKQSISTTPGAIRFLSTEDYERTLSELEELEKRKKEIEKPFKESVKGRLIPDYLTAEMNADILKMERERFSTEKYMSKEHLIFEMDVIREKVKNRTDFIRDYIKDEKKAESYRIATVKWANVECEKLARKYRDDDKKQEEQKLKDINQIYKRFYEERDKYQTYEEVHAISMAAPEPLGMEQFEYWYPDPKKQAEVAARARESAEAITGAYKQMYSGMEVMSDESYNFQKRQLTLQALDFAELTNDEYAAYAWLHDQIKQLDEKRTGKEINQTIDVLNAYQKLYDGLGVMTRASYENRLKLLDAEYKQYEKVVKDKALLDAWYAEQKKQLDMEMAVSSNDFFAGFSAGTYQIQQDLTTLGKVGQNTALTMNTSLTGALDNMTLESMKFKDAMKGMFVDILKSFGHMINQMLAEQMMLQIFQPMFGGLGGLFGGGTTTGVGTPTTPTTGPTGSISIKAHTGGIIGTTPFTLRAVPAETFDYAPKLHSGLLADEFPAILQKGELVFPKDTKVSHGNPNVVVNVINQNDQKLSAKKQNAFWQNDTYIVDVVIDDYNKGGKMFKTLGG